MLRNDVRDGDPDPTYGLTPGAEINTITKYFKNCGRCRMTVLVGQVTDVYRSIKWRTFDPTPIESQGLRYYRRHRCRPED